MRTRDGVELIGTDPTEIVKELHRMSRSPCATDSEFRAQMAARAQLQTGQLVRCESDEKFVADLVAVGLLLDE